MGDRQRIIAYDVMRGLAILILVATHISYDMRFREWCQISLMTVFYFSMGAFMNVNKGWFCTLRRRFARIMVPYLVFSLLSFAYWYWFERHFRGDANMCNPMKEFVNIFYPMNMTDPEPHIYNAPLWCLPCLFMASVIFDGMLRAFRNRWMLLGAVMTVAILDEFVTISAPFYIPQALAAIPFVYLGHLFQRSQSSICTWIERCDASEIILALTLVVSVILTHQTVIRSNLFTCGYLAYFGVSLLTLTAFVVSSVRIGHSRVLEWLGTCSLSIMLIHEPIKRVIIGVWAKVVGFPTEVLRLNLIDVAAVTICTLGVCYALIRGYEAIRHWRTWK